MAEPPRVRRVRVVRVKGKEGVLEVLRGLLSDFSYSTTYDVAVDEEDNVVYKYEVLHVTGQVSGEHIAVTCDYRGCVVEAPLYRYDGVEPCRCKPNPVEVASCVRVVAESIVSVKSKIEGLRALARELERYGFNVEVRSFGAEAYNSLGGGSYVRVLLSTRASMIQLQVQTDPVKVVELAKRIAEVLGGG
jgi:hypothetical protein